uniref:RING-CH-type domain-containing protein n=1 Tax=Setaria italica TaxID=4555 RepID=K3XRN4_SETIT
DELISPCMCKGTQQFVHRACLDHWRAVKEGTAFSHCTTCKAQFHLRVEFLEDDMRRRMKFQLFVARDIFLVFLAIQSILDIDISVDFLELITRGGKFRNSFAHHGDHILSVHPVVFYYCVGVVAFFALTGLCGLLLHCFSSDNIDPSCLVIYGSIAATMAFQNIMQRHYHILNKKELTKASGYAPPPKMDPVHEQRLKIVNPNPLNLHLKTVVRWKRRLVSLGANRMLVNPTPL